MSATNQPLWLIKAKSDTDTLSWELTTERGERKSESFRWIITAALMEGEHSMSCVLKVVLEFSSYRAEEENGGNSMSKAMKT